MSTQGLQNIFRREGRSLLQYVAEAYPWARVDDQATLAELQKMIAEEAQATGALASYMRRHHVELPYLGAYPDYTPLNYVGIDFLLPRLVEAQRQSVEALDKDLASLTDVDYRRQVEQTLEMKRRHLKKLEELASRHPAPVGA
jgi:hypothetical protein